MPIVEIADDGEPRASTEVIACGYKLKHKNVMALLRKYQGKMETFGLVAFQTRARLPGQHGGGDVEFARLNERQSMFLISLMHERRREKPTLESEREILENTMQPSLLN